MDAKEYTLVWEENFEYEGKPDSQKWNFEVGNHQWPNRELQAYTDREENVFLKDGKLVIRAKKEQDGEREYTSAKINTCQKASWTYGYFEFRAKLPRGQGSWPAIWMMPEHIHLPKEEQEAMGISTEDRKWPFCKPFYLILNVAVGGGLGGPVDDSQLPFEMRLPQSHWLQTVG